MKKIITVFLFAFLLGSSNSGFCQHTFSIVAVDSITGEVGGAGASCIDANNCCVGGAAIINDVHPGVGVIHCQAYLNSQNRAYAKNLMDKGYKPCQIIDSLKIKDAQNSPQSRQYGIVGLYNGHPTACAFTGSSADNYKSHIVKRYYSIQGNTLLGQKVLDSMEARFLRAQGDLACRLMAALQGAKMIGADTRCAPSKNSSLSAFIRVAKPGNAVNNLYMNIVVDKGPYRFEPIDSLQKRFNKVHNCVVTGMDQPIVETKRIDIYPNPFSTLATIHIYNDIPEKGYLLELYDHLGRLIRTETIHSNEYSLKKEKLVPGVYIYKLTGATTYQTGKLLVCD